MTLEEWEQVANDITYNYARDNYFAELKDLEMFRERSALLNEFDPYAGKYYSHAWIRKNVLKQTDDEMEELDQQMEQELEDPRYVPQYAVDAQEREVQAQQVANK